MKESKLTIPPTAFERVAIAMRDACDLFDKALLDKRVAENLERFDVARDLTLVADHMRMARLLLAEALRKAARAEANGEI